MGGGGNWFGNAAGNIWGSGSQSGAFGTGQYHSDAYKVPGAAFAPDANEQQLIKALQDRAYGKAPSAAEMQMRGGFDEASKQAQALGASQRGVDPALAARMAAQSQAQMLQQSNGGAAQMRAQEMANSQNALTNELQSVRTGRMNAEGLNSANYNSNNQTNAQAYEGAGNRRQNFNQGMSSMFTSMGGMMGGAKGGMASHAGFIRPMADGGSVDPTFAALLASINAPQKMQVTGLQSPSQAEQNNKGYAAAGKSMGKIFSGQKSKKQSVAGGPMDEGGAPDSGFLFAADGGEIEEGDKGPQLETPVAPPPAPAQGFQTPQMGGGGISVTPLQPAGQKSGGGGGGGDMMSGLMKMLPMLLAASNGGKVPGQAEVSGDSLKNDKVPVVLSPGEIVIPRSIVSKGPDAAKRFVAAILKQKGA